MGKLILHPILQRAEVQRDLEIVARPTGLLNQKQAFLFSNFSLYIQENSITVVQRGLSMAYSQNMASLLDVKC